jgi:hypothetical protein
MVTRRVGLGVLRVSNDIWKITMPILGAKGYDSLQAVVGLLGPGCEVFDLRCSLENSILFVLLLDASLVISLGRHLGKMVWVVGIESGFLVSG